MISLVRGSQVWEYVSDVFLTFNYKLRDKIITSAVNGRNLITATKGGKGATEIGIIMVARTKFNINHYCSWSKLLSKVLDAFNQESIDFRRNGSNWVWNKLVSSSRMPEIVPRTLSPKIQKVSGRNIFCTTKPKAFITQTPKINIQIKYKIYTNSSTYSSFPSPFFTIIQLYTEKN